LPEHPLHPQFTARYESAFEEDRRRLGLAGLNFDYFFGEIESHICGYPWEYSREVPASGGTRMLKTRDAFPDIPPLYVYFKVNANERRIAFIGLSEAWSASETFRSTAPGEE
jgi:hypothetical protein